jgi:hypothetical protein
MNQPSEAAKKALCHFIYHTSFKRMSESEKLEAIKELEEKEIANYLCLEKMQQNRVKRTQTLRSE